MDPAHDLDPNGPPRDGAPAAGNLFAELRGDGPGERVDALVERAGMRIERIVSAGHASAPGFWYDDPRDEWVALLSGSAALAFADGTTRRLAPGDHLLIPAHCRHRVEWTDPDVPTVWIAVYCDAGVRTDTRGGAEAPAPADR